MTTIHPCLPCWGVYRVLKSGAHEYVSRTATTSEKLAMEIASDLSIGRVIRPDGSELWVPAHPHVHQLIPNTLIVDTLQAHRDVLEQQAGALKTRLAQGGPSPKGWDVIEPGPDHAPELVTVALTLDELRELIHACWVTDDEGQSLDDVAFKSAWMKLNELQPEPGCPHCGYRHPPDGICVK